MMMSIGLPILLLVLLTAASIHGCPTDTHAVCFSPNGYKNTDPSINYVEAKFPPRNKGCNIFLHVDHAVGPDRKFWRTRCCKKEALHKIRPSPPYNTRDVFRIPKVTLVHGDLDSPPPRGSQDCF
ncbi:hypothetical protein PGTUg99_016408 [Puccinia graminis f. sp. tritici]|uniref:Uncharacterized protein n=1 Tax=Puccinia graminis f. sp. tritici TaxID=56615 RepID=A0A5B0LJB4_PUCGR|nr:hypothetical protein PGTUg99_016408 [Puccinia graminis f. sp. tritici]